jgi:peptidoglycan/xylan/chitin deacetylase (PgdA/CDA1 family)
MGTRNHLGDQFQREDLDVLLREGHDLAAHTYSHLSCRSVSASRFREDLRRGQQAVCQLGGQKGSGNFAFPFGEVTANAKRFVGPDVASARGIWGGLNGPIIDLNLLKANSLYGDESKRNGVQDLILENQRCGSWLIFYTHDVQSTPSRFGCTPELLEFAVSVASGSGARILTIAEVVNELVAERHEEPFGSRS